VRAAGCAWLLLVVCSLHYPCGWRHPSALLLLFIRWSGPNRMAWSRSSPFLATLGSVWSSPWFESTGPWWLSQVRWHVHHTHQHTHTPTHNRSLSRTTAEVCDLSGSTQRHRLPAALSYVSQ
jgi:hypothetical protein